MKRIEVFSLSAIDLLCSAFGCAFILAFVFAVIPILTGQTEHGRTLITIAVDPSQHETALLGTCLVVDGIRYDPFIDDPQGRVRIRPATRFSPRYEIEFSSPEFSEADALTVYLAENDPPDSAQRRAFRRGTVPVEVTKVGPGGFSRKVLELDARTGWVSTAALPAVAGPTSADGLSWHAQPVDGRHADTSPFLRSFDEAFRLLASTSASENDAFLRGRAHSIYSEEWARASTFRYQPSPSDQLIVRIFFPQPTSAVALAGGGPILQMWRAPDTALPSGLVQFRASGTGFLDPFNQSLDDFGQLSIAPSVVPAGSAPLTLRSTSRHAARFMAACPTVPLSSPPKLRRRGASHAIRGESDGPLVDRPGSWAATLHFQGGDFALLGYLEGEIRTRYSTAIPARLERDLRHPGVTRVRPAVVGDRWGPAGTQGVLIVRVATEFFVEFRVLSELFAI